MGDDQQSPRGPDRFDEHVRIQDIRSGGSDNDDGLPKNLARLSVGGAVITVFALIALSVHRLIALGHVMDAVYAISFGVGLVVACWTCGYVVVDIVPKIDELRGGDDG